VKEVEFVHELLVLGLRSTTLVERCDEVFDQNTDGDDISDRPTGNRHRRRVAVFVFDE
jgi:hypothetical protein